VVLHAVLLVLLLLVAVSKPEMQEEGGVPVMLGNMEMAQGNADPYTLTDVDVLDEPQLPTEVSAPEPVPTPPVESEMITQEDEPTVAVPKKETPKPAPKKEVIKKEPPKQEAVKPKEKTEAEKREEAERLAAEKRAAEERAAAEAAAKTHGKVIGVDSDQSPIIDAYAPGTTVTSAMKSLTATIYAMLDAIIVNDTWDEHVGKIENLGLVSGTDTSLNYVGLPEDTTQWNENFTVDDYKELVAKIYDGEIVIDDSVDDIPKVSYDLHIRQGTIM